MIVYQDWPLWKVLFTFKGSALANIVVPMALLIVDVALAAVFYETECFGGCPVFHIDDHPVKILAMPMMFLLVFKTSQSYGRYWEGRGAIGQLLKSGRNLFRSVIWYNVNSDTYQRFSRYATRHLSLFFVALEAHLRGDFHPANANADLHALQQLNTARPLVTDAEIKLLVGKEDKPLLVLLWITKDLKEAFQKGLVDEAQVLNIDKEIADMLDHYASVTKIKSTPFPFPYAQLLGVFIYLYSLSLPWLLMPDYGTWATFFVCVLMAIAVFGINGVAAEIEDPFGKDANDLPLDAMCATIPADVDIAFATTAVREIAKEQ